ncbi:MAG: UDP-N-acetylmuramoyl-tripeptide--D-alanyl-D-alanine ligase, partial [Holosporales bacterium]|nr:UDP-N-acetylmuramoyl-tripeptide--D-alanyl-D-alanine ligase [Holosporales bacterium]
MCHPGINGVYKETVIAKKRLIIGETELETNGFSIDSRSINPGEVFFALRGNRVDGHRFVSEAFDRGAVAAVIDNSDYHCPPRTILVNNVLETLKKAGLFCKNLANPGKMIGITGSVGKTTTKIWLSEVLNHYQRTFTTMNNYNTIYGLPIAFSRLDDDVEYCILELGTNRPGEISELSNYLSADIGLITNIFESHIGNFRDKSELANEKISIIDGMNPGGILIFDGDSEFSKRIKTAASGRQLKSMSVGFTDGCDVRITSDGQIRTDHGNYLLGDPVPGRPYDYIMGCMVATILALDLDVNKFLPYLKELRPLKGRGAIVACAFKGKTFKLIDESYNASPMAMLTAIDSFDKNYNSPRVAVIGQMKELGAFEEYYHRILGERLSRCLLDEYFFIGDRHLWNLLPGANCYETL